MNATVGFDLDMTLVDSAAGIVATMRETLGAVRGGRADVPEDEIRPWIGLPLEASVERIAPGVDVEEAVALYRSLYVELGVPGTRLMPGALDSIRAVHGTGGRVLVISAKTPFAVHAVLEHVGLGSGDLAPDLVAGGLFAAAKGELLRAEGAHVYVGDHPGDVEAAQVGGAIAVAVASGPTSAEDLAAAGAEVVLQDLEAFPAWLSDRLAVA